MLLFKYVVSLIVLQNNNYCVVYQPVQDTRGALPRLDDSFVTGILTSGSMYNYATSTNYFRASQLDNLICITCMSYLI